MSLYGSGLSPVTLDTRVALFHRELESTATQIRGAYARGGPIARGRLTQWLGTIQHAAVVLAELQGAMEAYQMLALVQKPPAPHQAAPDTTIETGPAPEVYGVA